jgi:PAS domain S-box-containing protein
MRVLSLQWTVGALCAFTGLLALVAPHQFRGPAYAAFQAQLPLWGAAFTLVGAGLIVSALFGPQGRPTALTSIVAAVALGVLGFGFSSIGVWFGVVNFGLLGLGIGLAPLLRTWRRPAELLSLVLGSTLIIDGALMLIAESRLASPALDSALPSFPLEGIGFALAGLGLLAAELAASRRGTSLAQPMAALVLLVHLFASNNLSMNIWTGIVYYGGFGLILALLPVLRSRLQHIDPYSLRMRLAVALAAAVAAPLLLATAVDGARDQRSTVEHTLTTQRMLAQAVANDVADYIGLHQRALEMLARFPDLLDMPAERQQGLLANATGTQAAWLDVSIQTGQGSDKPTVDAWYSDELGRSVVVIGVPILSGDARIVGALDSAELLQVLAQSDAGQGAFAYVVDRSGRVILHANPSQAAGLPTVTQRAPVRALLSGQAQGAMRDDGRRVEMLSAFARATDFGWGVVIERSVASALASSWHATDLLLGIMLLGIALAAAAGAIVADRLTAPLARLTRRLESFGDGEKRIEMPDTRITEIARLSTVFTQMQTRLARRTEQQHAAQAEIRALNAALEQRVADRTAELEVAVANLHAQISQRAHVESALRESEERYRHIVEASPEPILVHSNGVFVYSNPAGARLIGASTPAELIGTPVLAVVHPDSMTLVRDRIAQLSEIGGILPAAESRLQRLDGSIIEIESTEAAVTFDGRPAIQVLLRDVSDRKAVERMKDELISVISHELRTPLTSIRGSLGLLAGGVLGALPTKGQRMLDIAVNNADRLIRLLNDVLDLERMRAGRILMERRVCDLADVVEQAQAEMRGLAARSGVRLIASPTEGAVYADRDRLLQVLTNLLSNAIKFSHPDGSVWLTAEVWDDVVRFTVRDEGRGVPADKLESIFERFRQVDSSDSRDKGGTGLGLAICRTIIEQHGGTVWAESSLGIGSSFIVELPALSQPALAA